MFLKVLKAVWFLSVLALFATLLFSYASWREELIVQEEAGSQLVMGREVLFYVVLGVFLTINVLVYLVRNMFLKQEDFRAWFHGLVVTINIFFIIALSLLTLYNNGEKFDYDRIGFIIYGSVALIVAWACVWPVYLLYQKVFVKEAV